MYTDKMNDLKSSPVRCSDGLIARKEILRLSVSDLREMHMHPRWVKIAETIGIDAFVMVWRHLDETTSGPTVYAVMPRYTRYLRYQRNRFIE